MLNSLVTDLMEEVRNRVAALGAVHARRHPPRSRQNCGAQSRHGSRPRRCQELTSIPTSTTRREWKKSTNAPPGRSGTLRGFDGRSGTATRRPPGSDPDRRPGPHRSRLHRGHDRQLHRAALVAVLPAISRQARVRLPEWTSRCPHTEGRPDQPRCGLARVL